MREVWNRVLRVLGMGSYNVFVWAWMVLMGVASVTLTIGIVLVFWEIGKEALTRELVWGDLGALIFMVVFFFLSAALLYYIAWVSAVYTWRRTRVFADGVRDVTDTTRDVFARRAEKAERLEAQGGQISISLGDDSGGGLSEVTLAESGLEVVEADEEHHA